MENLIDLIGKVHSLLFAAYKGGVNGALIVVVCLGCVVSEESYACPRNVPSDASMTADIVAPVNRAVFTANPATGMATVEFNSKVMFRSGLTGYMSLDCIKSYSSFRGQFLIEGRSPAVARFNSNYWDLGGSFTSSANLPPGTYSVSVVGARDVVDSRVAEFIIPSPRQQVTFTVVGPPPGPVTGNVDSASVVGDQFVVSGWACDKNVNSSIYTHVYLHGPAGVGTLVLAPLANIPNEAAVDASCGTSGIGHRFVISQPTSVTSTYPKVPVYIYGLSASGGSNPLIGSFTLP